jgi:signal transduction histidine kinase
VPVDAVAFVHDQVERLRFTRAGESSVLTVAVHAEPSSVVAHWDPDLLGHALQAVLDNAVRSAEPPPSVTVTVRQTAGRVRIEVSDRGKGIPREILARLSIPMSVRRPGGAGLGLAIARKMVEAHHGRLAVESGNAGTTVCFDLPVEAFPG